MARVIFTGLAGIFGQVPEPVADLLPDLPAAATGLHEPPAETPPDVAHGASPELPATAQDHLPDLAAVAGFSGGHAHLPDFFGDTVI
jgi:hypothetical protein